MANDSGQTQVSRIPGESAESGAQPGPSNLDIWQAASLLIGVYGGKAGDYAGEQRDRLDDLGDRSGAMVWQRIQARIEALLDYAPLRTLN